MENQSQHSENLYEYKDTEGNNNEPPKESNAIRRSIGTGENPYKYNLKNSSLENNNINNINNNPSYNQNFPNYQDKSTEQRLPRNSEANVLKQPHINNINNNNKQNSSEDNNNNGINLNLGVSSNTNINNPQLEIPNITFIFLILLQVAAVIVIATAYEIGDGDPNNNINSNDFGYYYHFMKDIHLMIFIGFGLLYTSLKNHQKTSISLVLFLGIISLEFSFLFNYFWNNALRRKKITEYPLKWSRLGLTMEEISQIDFFCASAIISLGALIGKLKLGQYLLSILFETFFASLNYFICYFTLGGIDTGGSVYVFAFGAIFGFSVSFTMSYDPRFKENLIRNQNKKSNYYSNIISAIGSLFIWLYFPSFNTARIHYNHDKDIREIMRYRGIVNTYMALFGSTITTFCVSALLTEEKFRMQHILRSSYTGGVVIAGCCTFCPYPWCALILGMVGGGVSVLLSHLAKENKLGPKNPPNPFRYKCISDFIDAIKMSDTMDVLYCFGVPGIIGGIFSSIFLGSFEHKPWDKIELDDLFYYHRTPGEQGGIQFSVLIITIVLAIISGILVGSINRCFDFYGRDLLFNDASFFEENNDSIFPRYTKKNFLSSSENQLNNDEQDGVEVEVNNNNVINNNIE